MSGTTLLVPEGYLSKTELEVRTCSDVYFPQKCCFLPLRTAIYLVSWIHLCSGLAEICVTLELKDRNIGLLLDEKWLPLLNVGGSFHIAFFVLLSGCTLSRSGIVLSIMGCVFSFLLNIVLNGKYLYRVDFLYWIDKHSENNNGTAAELFEKINVAIDETDFQLTACYFRLVLALITGYVMLAFGWRLKFRPITLLRNKPSWQPPSLSTQATETKTTRTATATKAT